MALSHLEQLWIPAETNSPVEETSRLGNVSLTAASAVPEPSAAWLMLLGVGAFAALRRVVERLEHSAAAQAAGGWLSMKLGRV